MPYEDLDAKSTNTYNTVSSQIVDQVTARQPMGVTISLGGTSDSGNKLTVLNRLNQGAKYPLLSSDKSAAARWIVVSCIDYN